jgi:hypothetical protein
MDFLFKKQNLISFFIAFLLVIPIAYIDRGIIDRNFFREGVPIFNSIYLLRTLLLFLSAIFIVYPFWKLKKLENHGDSVLNNSWYSRLIFGTLLLSVAFTIYFIVDPAGFCLLGQEDNIIEGISAYLYFGSSVLFGIIFYKSIRNSQYIISLLALFLTLSFIFCGMEEISWFQRTLEIETPEYFAKNRQQEMNFHNFKTNYFENAFYTGTFIFFIIVPALLDTIGLFKNVRIISVFMPGRLILFTGSIGMAYSYDMWNVYLTQWGFFVTLFVLTFYALYANGQDKLFARLCLAALIFSQAVFLFSGNVYSRLWDITEYKEFFMPLTFLFYSIEVLIKNNKSQIPQQA